MIPLDAALAYATRGWYVFPIRAGTKAPLTPNGFYNASVDPEAITAWWSQHPDANIGIALEPSGLVVLDVDCKKGAKGYESLAELSVDSILRVKTPTGGLHIYFLRPEGVTASRVIGFKPGLDLLGAGYVLAPPSFLRGYGRPYEHPPSP